MYILKRNHFHKRQHLTTWNRACNFVTFKYLLRPLSNTLHTYMHIHTYTYIFFQEGLLFCGGESPSKDWLDSLINLRQGNMLNQRALGVSSIFSNKPRASAKIIHNHHGKCTFYFVAPSSRYCFGFLMRNKLAFMIQILKPLGHCVINRVIDFALDQLKQLCPLASEICTAKSISTTFTSALSLVLEVKSQQKCGSHSQRTLQVQVKQLISFGCINMAIVRLICHVRSTRKTTFLIAFMLCFCTHSF